MFKLLLIDLILQGSKLTFDLSDQSPFSLVSGSLVDPQYPDVVCHAERLKHPGEHFHPRESDEDL